AVPDLGDALLINGDLFDFWFEYGSVIPRRHFGTVAKLHALRARGVPITFVGGNHDRWGGDFLIHDLGIAFHPGEAEPDVAGPGAVRRAAARTPAGPEPRDSRPDASSGAVAAAEREGIPESGSVLGRWTICDRHKRQRRVKDVSVRRLIRGALLPRASASRPR